MKQSSFTLIVVVTACLLGATVLLWEPTPHPTDSTKFVPTELTLQEMAAEPRDQASMSPTTPDSLEPLSIDSAQRISIGVVSESGYYNEKNEYVVDLLERDYAYLSVQLTTDSGHPIEGATPDITIEGSSRLLQPNEVSYMSSTDKTGMIEFAVAGGKMGVDRVRVAVGDAHADILINVISLSAAGFPQLANIEGGIPWEQLALARVTYTDLAIETEFPTSVLAQSGKIIRVTGYMMPLETEELQRHFLLTSNPPSCFFHIPGGPTGAIEVLTETGIEVSWDPVILEGRFEPLVRSEAGFVYRLHDALLLAP
jgi:hypothetical protein